MEKEFIERIKAVELLATKAKEDAKIKKTEKLIKNLVVQAAWGAINHFRHKQN